MNRGYLFRRRQVWLPTIFGWLLLFTIAAAAGLLAWRCLYSTLAPNEPAPNAGLFVVEGWMSGDELDQAAAAFHKGHYDRVVTSGGPMEHRPELFVSQNYAEYAARYLSSHGLAGIDVTAVPAPASAQDRTFLSAVKVRDWAAKQGIVVKALDVFSAGVHSRRTRMLYRMAFGNGVKVGIFSARPSEYDETNWWKSSAGAKAVVGETLSLIWTVCCFRPPAPGSKEELWGPPRPTAR